MAGTTAERVAALLLAFEPKGDGEHSVGELAYSVGRERSQVSRMLKALAAGGLLEQNPVSRKYRLGWNLKVLAAGAGDDVLVRACTPVLQILVARTGEAALLSVLERGQSLTVLREESHQSLQAGGWVGRRSPLFCTASGRALLLDADNERTEALTSQDFALSMPGPGVPQNLEELLRRLRSDRERGYSVASEEIEIGLTSIAAPVRDARGNIVGAINVSGPTSRISDRIPNIGELLVRSAASVRKALSG